MPLHAAPAQVELIVFAYNRNLAQDDEWFVAQFEKIQVDEHTYFDLEEDLDLPQQQDASTMHPYPVPPTQLNNIAKRIDENPDLELLTHLSWIQEPNPKRMTKPVHLDLKFDDSSIFSDLILSGYASLYEVQLLLQFEFNATFKPQPDTTIDTANLPQSVSLVENGPEYKIFERRRVLIDELHYIDHPRFGAVFKVTRP